MELDIFLWQFELETLELKFVFFLFSIFRLEGGGFHGDGLRSHDQTWIVGQSQFLESI